MERFVGLINMAKTLMQNAKEQMAKETNEHAKKMWENYCHQFWIQMLAIETWRSMEDSNCGSTRRAFSQIATHAIQQTTKTFREYQTVRNKADMLKSCLNL